MRRIFAEMFYFTLVAPLLLVVGLGWVLEKAENSKTLSAWESWARKLTKKVTGV